MAETTKIGWCDKTWSPWLGCTKVSAACDHCYAEAWAKRSGLVKWGNEPRRRTSTGYWMNAVKWNKAAGIDGKRVKVFPSLCDPFDNQVTGDLRADFWALIDITPNLDWLLLTKRPQNVGKLLPQRWNGTPPPNVWLGMTAENQEEYDRRWPHIGLMDAIKFVSYEPALGPLSLYGHFTQPDWIIFGGESGPHKRPVDLQWGRNLRDECAELGVAFYGKQHDGVRALPEDLMVRQIPELRP